MNIEAKKTNVHNFVKTVTIQYTLQNLLEIYIQVMNKLSIISQMYKSTN